MQVSPAQQSGTPPRRTIKLKPRAPSWGPGPGSTAAGPRLPPRRHVDEVEDTASTPGRACRPRSPRPRAPPGKRRKPAESPYRPRRPGSPSSQAHGTRQKGPFRAGRKFNGVGKRHAAARSARHRELGFPSFLQQETKTSRQGFDVFSKLPTHKSKKFPIRMLWWPVLGQDSGGWDAKRPNFPGPKRGVPCTESAPGRELSIAQGPGLIQLKPAFLRIFS